MTHTNAEQRPVLTAADLKGFDRRRVELIREMEDHGWRGRRGAKHHIIMRAPDGTTTTAISRRVISPKDQHNTARDFRTWLRRQEMAATPTTEPEIPFQAPLSWPAADATSVLVALATSHRPDLPEIIQADVTFADVTAVDTAKPQVEPDVTRNCGLCDRPFATLQALSVHRVRVHSKVACAVCDQPMSPSNLPRHLRGHVEQMGTHEETMREVLRLRAELAQARDEATEWERMADEIEDRYTAVKDRLDNAVGFLLGDSPRN